MNKLKKKYLFLFIIIIIGVIIGFVFSNILSVNDEKLVYTKLTTFFNNLRDDVPINYIHNLISSIKNNITYLFLIFIFGLSIVGLFLNNFILFFKSFIIGFTLGSIISIYLYKGIILAIVYMIPSVILNIFLLFIATSYANNLSLMLFRTCFKGLKTDYRPLIRKYLKIFGLLLVALIFSSLLETFLTPFLLKLFSFLLK